MSTTDLKDLILLSRSVEWRYKLDTFENAALADVLVAADQARKEVIKTLSGADYARVFEGAAIELDAHSVALLDELDDLTAVIRSRLTGNIRDIATIAADKSLQAHNDFLSFGGRVAGFNLVALTAEQIRANFVDVPFGGHLLSEWVDRSFAAQKDTIRRELAAGLFKGEGYPALVRRIDQGLGIMTKREAITIARTHVQSVNVAAQEAVFAANQDIIKGLKWFAKLENSNLQTGHGTCLRCAGLDGQEYGFDDVHPPIPLHPRCRCMLLPETKTFRELGLDRDEIKKAYRPYTTREPKNIDAGGRRTIKEVGFEGGDYGEWFDGRDRKFQANVVGPRRLELIEAGRVKFDDLVDVKTGKLLTIDELKKGVSGAVGSPTAPVSAGMGKAVNLVNKKAQNQTLVNLAKKAQLQYNESKIGPSVIVPEGSNPEKRAALTEMLDKLKTQNVNPAKIEGFNYLKASIENMKKNGWAGVVHYDLDGDVYAAAAIDKVLKDSIHVDTFGGLGKGTGQGVLYRLMQYSKEVAGVDGQISLYAIGDNRTIEFYLKHGFDTRPGASDGREMLTVASYVKRFMKWFEENKI